MDLIESISWPISTKKFQLTPLTAAHLLFHK